MLQCYLMGLVENAVIKHILLCNRAMHGTSSGRAYSIVHIFPCLSEEIYSLAAIQHAITTLQMVLPRLAIWAAFQSPPGHQASPAAEEATIYDAGTKHLMQGSRCC